MPPKMTKRTEADVLLGKRIRQARRIAGMSQTALGKAAGVSFQQVQKYESAYTVITVSRLLELAAALGQQPEYFIKGLAPAAKVEAPDVRRPSYGVVPPDRIGKHRSVA